MVRMGHDKGIYMKCFHRYYDGRAEGHAKALWLVDFLVLSFICFMMFHASSLRNSLGMTLKCGRGSLYVYQAVIEIDQNPTVLVAPDASWATARFALRPNHGWLKQSICWETWHRRPAETAGAMDNRQDDGAKIRPQRYAMAKMNCYVYIYIYT